MGGFNCGRNFCLFIFLDFVKGKKHILLFILQKYECVPKHDNCTCTYELNIGYKTFKITQLDIVLSSTLKLEYVQYQGFFINDQNIGLSLLLFLIMFVFFLWFLASIHANTYFPTNDNFSTLCTKYINN